MQVKKLRVVAMTLMLALAVSFFAAAPQAQAVKKPAELELTAVPGGNAVRVSFKAPGGSVHYRIRYATNSSFRGAKYYHTRNQNRSMLTVLTPGKRYWVSVAVVSADEKKLLSAWSSAKSVKVSSWGYTPPLEIDVVNIGSTFAELSWRTVSGAPGYQVRAQGGGKTLYLNNGSTGTGTLRGLKPKTKYKFTVRVQRPKDSDFPARVQLSRWSKASVTAKTTNRAVAAPKNLTVVKHGSTTATIDFDHSDLASNQCYMVSFQGKGGNRTLYFNSKPAQATGLKDNVTYSVRAAVVKVSNQATCSKPTLVSDVSSAVALKTYSKWGYVAGTVTMPATTYDKRIVQAVATAYEVEGSCSSADSLGELANQVDVAADGTYKLKLRPGKYCVQVDYIGAANIASAWVDGVADVSVVDVNAAPVNAAAPVSEESGIPPEAVLPEQSGSGESDDQPDQAAAEAAADDADAGEAVALDATDVQVGDDTVVVEVDGATASAAATSADGSDQVSVEAAPVAADTVQATQAGSVSAQPADDASASASAATSTDVTAAGETPAVTAAGDAQPSADSATAAQASSAAVADPAASSAQTTASAAAGSATQAQAAASGAASAAETAAAAAEAGSAAASDAAETAAEAVAEQAAPAAAPAGDAVASQAAQTPAPVATADQVVAVERADSNARSRIGSASWKTSRVITVAEGQTVNAAPMALTVGGTITGKIVSSTTKKAVSGVYVAAINVTDGATLVPDQVLTNSKGQYTLTGLPAGTYKLRLVYAGYGWTATEVPGEHVVAADSTTSVDGTIAPLKMRTFPKGSIKIVGQKKLRAKLTISMKGFVVGTSPTVRPDVAKIQWYRNGKKIDGAVWINHYMTKPDRGKNLQVKVTLKYFGYKTKTVWSSKFHAPSNA
ncbi:MAG: carboxypeptidase regulatory-like domain-containing protein [Propionibacteriaceae bacterium]|jgi:hypothetical protein|nr:carboxypeptidase regulatory-like domain-containing protein [Propionibacteriaceae bacterium]